MGAQAQRLHVARRGVARQRDPRAEAAAARDAEVRASRVRGVPLERRRPRPAGRRRTRAARRSRWPQASRKTKRRGSGIRFEPGLAPSTTRPSRLTSTAETWYVQGWASITASRETPSSEKGTGASATRGVAGPRSLTMLFFVTTYSTGWLPSRRPANGVVTWSLPWYCGPAHAPRRVQLDRVHELDVGRAAPGRHQPVERRAAVLVAEHDRVAQLAAPVRGRERLDPGDERRVGEAIERALPRVDDRRVRERLVAGIVRGHRLHAHALDPHRPASRARTSARRARARGGARLRRAAPSRTRYSAARAARQDEVLRRRAVEREREHRGLAAPDAPVAALARGGDRRPRPRRGARAGRPARGAAAAAPTAATRGERSSARDSTRAGELVAVGWRRVRRMDVTSSVTGLSRGRPRGVGFASHNPDLIPTSRRCPMKRLLLARSRRCCSPSLPRPRWTGRRSPEPCRDAAGAVVSGRHVAVTNAATNVADPGRRPTPRATTRRST